MRWGTYFAVLASVLSVGLALGVSMPLVSLRLEAWGYGSFAIGVMAAMPALGVLAGASLASRLAGWVAYRRRCACACGAGRCRLACSRCCLVTRYGCCCG